MPHEIMTKVAATLGDKTIALFRDPSQSDDGAIYFTAKEGADALGLSSYRKFLELVRAHRDELVEGEEIVTPSGTIGGKGRDTKLFRISVLDLLGPLTKSEAGKMIRRWTADIRQRFRRGTSAEITREQFDVLKAERDALLADRNEWRTRALDGEMRIGRMEGRFEGLCVLLESRVSRDAGNVSDAKKHPDLMAIGRDKRRRDALEKAGRGRDVFLFDGMEGPDAFEALRARCFEVVSAEVKKNGAALRATPYRRHSFARLVKGCSHRQAIAAVESLVADGSIDVRAGKVSVATAMTTARKPSEVTA